MQEPTETAPMEAVPEPRDGEAATAETTAARSHSARRRGWAVPDGPALAAFLLPAALIIYLGVESGGFGEVVYSQVGIAAWWIVLLGTLAGVFRFSAVGRWGWLGFALLAGFGAWTMLGVSWSSSSERSVIEVARVASYLGVLAFAVLSGGRERVRPMLAGVGAGCAAVAAIALMSRLQPSWFPANELADVLPSVESRLAYPLGYWNALAGLIAIGMPLVIWLATSARSLAARGLAAGFVPLMILTSYYTLSRGGAVATAVGVLALIALSGRRLALVVPVSVMALGGAALIWAAERRPSLQSGRVDDIAVAQGHAMIWITLAVGVVAALVVCAIALAARRGRLPAAPRVPRRPALAALAVVIAVAFAAFFAFDGPGRVDDGWETFKEPSDPGSQVDRLSSASGNGRWQYWSAAIDAFEEQPVHGIGPGTFVFWWSQHRDIPGFIRDAHSLFAETLGELGIVGLLLIGGFIGVVVLTGAGRALRAAGRDRRALAAATASALAFAVAAGIDWLWELAVIPVAFIFVAAAILRAGGGERPETLSGARRRPLPLVVGAGIASVLAIGVVIALIVIPMRGSEAVADSQAAFRAGDYEESLNRAEDAHDLQPYAASPLMQEAFALQALGDDSKAATAAREATAAESTNWETWYVLSRVQLAREKEGAALVALHRAQQLDPLSPLLNPDVTSATPTSAPPG